MARGPKGERRPADVMASIVAGRIVSSLEAANFVVMPALGVGTCRRRT
jgi:hypothetical protein